MVIPEAFESYYRENNFFIPKHGVLIETGFPFMPIPWMEAIIGLPNHGIARFQCYWITTLLGRSFRSLDAIEARVLDPNNPWLQKLLEFQKFRVNTFHGDKPVGLPDHAWSNRAAWQALCWVGEG